MADAFEDAVTRMQARDDVDVVVVHFTNNRRSATVRPHQRQAKGVLADCRSAGLPVQELGRITASTTPESFDIVVVMVDVPDLDIAAAVCAAGLAIPDLPSRIEDPMTVWGRPANADLAVELRRDGFNRLVEGSFGETLSVPPAALTAARLLLDQPPRRRRQDTSTLPADLEARADAMVDRLLGAAEVLVTGALLEREPVQVKTPSARREPPTR